MRYPCLATIMFVLLCAPAYADTPAVTITWKKIVVDKKFRSEGVAIADVNKDGKMDVVTGDVWYEAPDWKAHEIRKPKRDYGDGFNGYSECMCCWTADINNDGWPDSIVVGFPGAPCYWYENPKGESGHWKEHMIWDSACNETPLYVDLLGNGKKVLLMGFQPAGQQNMGQMAYFSPGADPTKRWEMHPISEPSTAKSQIPGTQRFSHGLGATDLNGDGKLDVVCTGGWWEQPAKNEGKPWKFHAANLGEACSDMHAYDLDGDGKLDIISSSAHKFGIWCHLQKPGSGDSPTFLKQDLFPKLVSETHALHFVDINGDGLKDLVTGKRWWSHGKNEPGSDMPSTVYWLEAKRGKDGMTTFTPHQIDDASGIGTQFTVADFNGDGLLDIVVSNKRGTHVLLQVRGLATTSKTDQ